MGLVKNIILVVWSCNKIKLGIAIKNFDRSFKANYKYRVNFKLYFIMILNIYFKNFKNFSKLLNLKLI